MSRAGGKLPQMTVLMMAGMLLIFAMEELLQAEQQLQAVSELLRGMLPSAAAVTFPLRD